MKTSGTVGDIFEHNRLVTNCLESYGAELKLSLISHSIKFLLKRFGLRAKLPIWMDSSSKVNSLFVLLSKLSHL